MDIEIKIDKNYSVPKVIVLTQTISDEINALITRISEDVPQLITGYRENIMCILEQHEIIRVFSGGGKVYAVTESGEFALRYRLYEMEEWLDKSIFVRISNSEIVNLKQVQSFDMSFTGTLRVNLKNSDVTYVSRRYVSKIKSILGV